MQKLTCAACNMLPLELELTRFRDTSFFVFKEPQMSKVSCALTGQNAYPLLQSPTVFER